MVAAAATQAAVSATAVAAAPPPCGGVPQISDPVGDGHHANTDVVAGWFSEQAGRLQAVIQPNQARWEPDHDDSDAAGFAFLFETAGSIRYVRLEAFRPPAPPLVDYGTWTRSGGFAKAGDTTGETSTGGGGAATIDVPAQAGATAGAVLARPFVLTYDGGANPAQHWVDRAPGGVSPDETAPGADFVVGSCSGPGGTPPPGGVRTTAVTLSTPRRIVGGGNVRVSGRVTPARGGVPVELSARARRSVQRSVTTRSDGTFAMTFRVSETTRLRAVAEGIGSQTRTLTVFSKVRIKVRNLENGSALVTGEVSPKLPGRVLWLRTDAAAATARTTARNGRFKFRLRDPRRGRYQAVFIPSGRRAERSTSNTGVIR